MNYSLGNMLGGGNGSLNPDKLSLDLQFATDKTLTARKGPTPTFTRASSATQVGATGLIEYAPENLALQSENFGTTWSNSTGNALTLNDALSPTGTLTADRIDFPATATTGLIRILQQNFGSTVAGNGPVTASVWLRTVSGTSTVYLTLLDGGPPWQRVHVACNVTTEWTRFSVTLNNPLVSLFLLIGPDTRTTNGTPAQPAVQDAASVYAWGAQLERSSTARTYIPTTTAPVYGARFDHDPITLDCKGLLIEESRTNFVLNSDLYSTSSTTNITATTITGTSVTGLNQIRELSLTSSGNFTGVQSNLTGTGTGTKTLSVFIKKPASGGSPYFTIGFASSVLTYAGIQLTMSGSNPVISVTSTPNTFAVVSSSLKTFSNGWYQVSVVVSGTATSCFTTMFPSNALWDGISDIRQTLTASGTNLIYIFGAQLEAGEFATSYIPTTTTSVVRSADVCSITGSDFTGFYNGSEGTMVATASAAGFTSSNNTTVVAIDSGTIGVMRIYHRVAFGNRLSALVSGVQLTPASNYNTANVIYKSAFAAGVDGADYVIDGTQIPDTFTGSVLTADNLKFSGVVASTSNTTISSFRYYKKRLADAKLVSLTS